MNEFSYLLMCDLWTEISDQLTEFVVIVTDLCSHVVLLLFTLPSSDESEMKERLGYVVTLVFKKFTFVLHMFFGT